MSTIRGGSVPIVISYRKVSKRPKVKTTRKFVGPIQIFRNIAVKAIEAFESVAYDVENEILEAGVTKVVHWAINVDDPWGINEQASLTASRLPDKPACGAHFEIVMLDPSLDMPEEDINNVRARRPQNHPIAAERIREALIRDGHYDPEAGPPPTPQGT